MAMKISAVLPVYNVAAYLPRCLDSILATGYPDLEIICVNDGSTDNSLEILRQYEARDSRIIIFDKANGGVSSARNAGLKIAVGEYVTFIDPDDYIHPRYFEVLAACAERHDADFVIGSFTRIEESALSEDVMLPEFSECPETQLTVLDFFRSHQARTYSWGRLLRRPIAVSVPFNEGIAVGEDGIFNSELFTRYPGLCVWSCDAPIYIYVQRAGSAMSGAKEDALFEVAVQYEARITGAPVTEQAFLIPAIRRGLTVRYLCTHIHPDRDLAKRCRALLRRCAKRLSAARSISKKEKLLDLAMIRIPGLYWLYRVRQPGMWKWEKVQRKQRRAEKKRG